MVVYINSSLSHVLPQQHRQISPLKAWLTIYQVASLVPKESQSQRREAGEVFIIRDLPTAGTGPTLGWLISFPLFHTQMTTHTYERLDPNNMRLARTPSPHEERWKLGGDRGTERGWRRQTEVDLENATVKCLSLLRNIVHLVQHEAGSHCQHLRSAAFISNKGCNQRDSEVTHL